MNTKTITWNDHEIEFIRQYGEWYANLDDTLSALHLNKDDILNELDLNNGDAIGSYESPDGTVYVNELNVYLLGMMSGVTSTKQWYSQLMRQFRRIYGFEGYEVFRLLDEDIQSDISAFLNTIYWDDVKGRLMRSVTLPGGDVEQVSLSQI